MRFKSWSFLSILLVVGSIDARPSKPGSLEIVEENGEKSVTKGSGGGGGGGIVDDSSTWRPTESRSSSVVKTDSRYRGRTENSTEFTDKYYQSSFSPGLVNSFEIDENFGLPSGWQLLGSARILKSNINNRLSESDKLIDEIKRLRFSVVKSDDSSIFNSSNMSRKSQNDKFTKLHSSSIASEDVRSNIRQNNHSSKDTIKTTNKTRSKQSQNLSGISINAKNRVVFKSDYQKKPSRDETTLRPVSLATNQKFKNWPNEPIQDVQDLFNYDRYTSSIETVFHEKPPSNYSGAPPVLNGLKIRKKKPGNQIASSDPIKYQNHNPSDSNDEKWSSTSQQSLLSSSSYNREPLMQPNVEGIIQWLQMPTVGPHTNPSHSASNVLPEAFAAEPFHHTYHDFATSRPVTSATTYSDLENMYPGTSVPTKNYVNEIPVGMTHYQQVPSENPIRNEPSTSSTHYQQLGSHNQYLPAKNSYEESENHHQASPNHYQSSGNYYKPMKNHQFHPQTIQMNGDYHSTLTYVETPISEKPSFTSNEPIRPVETVSLPTSVVTLLTDLASKQTTNLHRWPIFKPSSEISQNTIVHILNPGSKRPNVTVSEMKLPQIEKPLSLMENYTNESAIPPNVHIMFTNEDTSNIENPLDSQSIPGGPLRDKNCPTIMINSITRVNNTIESKESCTDLNIVINSQVLSTNVFKPGSSVSQSNNDSQDKYVDSYFTDSPQQLNAHHNFPENNNASLSNFSQDNSEQDSDRNDIFDQQSTLDDSSVFTSTVTQESEIVLTATRDPPQEDTFDALGEADIADASASPEQSPVSGLKPQINPTSLTESGAGVGQAIGDSASNGQVPILTATSGLLPALPPAGSAGISSIGSPGSPSSSTALAPVYDDGDDDDFDMSLSGLVESMGSIFTYFTFLNPFNYGLFSLAAAPFAAMTASFVGVAAIFFPWALPGVLDFGRAADKVTIRFRPSLVDADVGQQSMHKYRDWHESKRKRKKSKNRTRKSKLSNDFSVHHTSLKTELKSLDQSLRTVATQLLNVTSPNEPKNPTDTQKITKSPKISSIVSPIQKINEKTNLNVPGHAINDKANVKSAQDVNSSIISLGTADVGFGRPVNSKFSHFESSHPGVAMAMTEEELERELRMGSGTSTRLITAHKNHPTTTGGISTWILLNSPSTTGKSTIDSETSDEKVVNVKVQLENKSTTPVEIFETTVRSEFKTASTLAKIVSPQSATPMERITTLSELGTTPSLKKPIALATSTTEKPQKLAQPTVKMEKWKVSPSPKVAYSRVETTGTAGPTATPKTTATTKKPLDIRRSTLRAKLTTPKPIDVTSKPMSTKISRPSIDPSTKPKTPPTRKPSTKYPVETTKNPSTWKIEKVTFRPVPMITTPESTDNRPNVERPIFLTKVKTSFTADTNASHPQSSLTNGTIVTKNETKSYLGDVVNPLVVGKTKKPPKMNNVLKVQLKKPTEAPTNIEIQPIKVNTPVLRIEKIESKENTAQKRNSTKIVPSLIPNDSRIDVKFDFNPEATKVEVEAAASPVDSIATTKRPPSPPPHKRKKNKVRRRRPTTSAAPSTSMTDQTTSDTSVTDPPPPELATSTETFDILTELGIIDNTIQESKIAPESKVTPGKGANNTKNKKKQVQKPIGTQIYNFLSREVMPSFGVMSLVGLGLGLASYFLYPFGGTIARRNYVVEQQPYKYNMDEYGGMYGQNEEDVFSKVLQGMTNQDGKYGGIKDYENNFYRYQQPYGGHHHTYAADIQHTTRRVPPDTSKYSTSSASIDRPVQTTMYEHEKYRNTEFKYPELSSTPNYYESPKKADFVGKKSSDRQFVVGNVPKEYNYDNRANLANAQPIATENRPTNFYQQQDNHKFPVDTADILPPYGQAEALKSPDDYEEIEIRPSAVQVEHGPRSFKLPASTKLARRRRDSVIQLIPSRTEIEKEEKEIETEEPLSNEILDIIDSVIPGPATHKSLPNYSEISANEKINGAERAASTSTDVTDPLTKQQQSIGVTTETGITEKITLASKRDTEQYTKKTSLTAELTNTESIGSTDKFTTGSSQPKTTSKSVDSGSSTVETTTGTDNTLTIDEIIGTTRKTVETNAEDSSIESIDNTTKKPNEEAFNMFSFVKKIAEVKLRLGVAILKHASEGFARYLGHVQKRINGEE